MRQFKLTAIMLGLLSATALPALAGPMGHAHFGGGEAAEAVATSTSAQATAAKTMVGLNQGSALKSQVGNGNAKNAVQNKAKVANGTTKSRLESQENFVKSLADVNAGPTIPTTSGKAEQSVAKAKAVQTQTGIAVDSLAIANSSKANNTELFR